MVYDFLNLKILVSARALPTDSRQHVNVNVSSEARVLLSRTLVERPWRRKRGISVTAALLRQTILRTGIKGRRTIFFLPLGKTTPVFERVFERYVLLRAIVSYIWIACTFSSR